MNRNVTLALALVAALAALYLFAGKRSPNSPHGGQRAAAQTAGAPKEQSGTTTADGVPGDANESDTEARRTQLVDAGRRRRARGGQVRLRVINHATSNPVAGATVRHYMWAARDSLSAAEIYDHDRLEIDTEELLKKFGEQLVTDHEGYVHAPWRRFLTVTARKDELYGSAEIDYTRMAPFDGYVIKVKTDLVAHIRVVNSAGEPVAAVPIGAVIQTKSPWDTEASPETVELGTSDSRGLLEVRHLQQRLAKAEADKANRKFARIGVLLPGCEAAGVRIDATAPPKELIELLMPPTGRVVLRAQDKYGTPVPDLSPAYLLLSDPRPLHSHSLQDCVRAWFKNGIAVLNHVPLGKTWGASALELISPLHIDIVGPRREGEEVVAATLIMPTQGLFLVGRAVDENGNPLQRLVLGAEMIRPGYVYGKYLHGRTNDSGEFHLPMKDSCFDIPIKESFVGKSFGAVEIHAFRGDLLSSPPPLFAKSAAIGTLGLGERDLGELVFKMHPLIVAGRIVDQKGMPVAGITGNLEFWTSEDEKEASEKGWRHAEVAFTSKNDGSFVIHNRIPGGPLRLTIDSPTHNKTAPVEFTVGAKDLVIEVENGGDLWIVILVDESTDARLCARDIALTLMPVGATIVQPSTEEKQAIAMRQHGYPVKHKPGPWSFVWLQQVAGKYRLEIRAATDEAPFETIDIEIFAGEVIRREVDIHGRLNAFQITLIDASGEAVPTSTTHWPKTYLPAGAVFVRGQSPGAPWIGLTYSGETTIVTSREAVNISVLMPGHRERRIDGVRGDTEVRLSPAYRAVLHVGNISTVPRCVEMQIGLKKWSSAQTRLALVPTTVEMGGYLLDVTDHQHPERLPGEWRSGTNTFEVARLGEFIVTAKFRHSRACPDGEAKSGWIYFKVNAAEWQHVAVTSISPNTIQVVDSPRPQEFRIYLDVDALKVAVKRWHTTKPK